MKSARRISLLCLAVIVAAGCASTSVTQRDVRVKGKIPRPDRILVYDFAAAPADVPPESAFASRSDAPQRLTADQLAEGRALGAEVARDLVANIKGMGLPAVRATSQTAPRLHDIVIRGYFLSIDQGSAAERMLVGFGSGTAQLTTAVEGFQMTEQGLRKLGSGTVDSSGGKTPGAAVPAAVAIATANPIGLVVTSAVKVAGEASGRSTIEGRGKQTAKEIAKALRPRFEQQGWIQ